ncbi:MAG: nitroreductase family protein [Candidatus Thorarchaeota archaeon]
MDILEALYTRRSIRKYRMSDIPDEIVQKVLRAAMSAPTSGNQRPWQFVVVRDREKMENLIEAYPYAKMLRDVPVAIMVCFDKDREKYEERWQLDCANATLNMLLAIHGLGFGGLWLEVFPIQERVKMIQDFFGMPDTIVPLAIVPIGHPAEKKPAEDRYEESLVHYDSW